MNDTRVNQAEAKSVLPSGLIGVLEKIEICHGDAVELNNALICFAE